jgi:hypothetical protein
MNQKTIFELITLQTIKNLLDLSKTDLSSKDKMLYINCLYGYFVDKTATIENLESFDIYINDLKNYSSWSKNFENLHNAELIEVTKTKITFFNHWSNFINLDVVITEEEKFDNGIEQKLLENRSMIDVVGMKNRLSIDQIKQLIKIFVKEQKATDSKHKDEGEYAKHFIYWVRTNLDNVSQEKQSSVKSAGKLLGL